jgi:Tfp pilus assembly protein PilO
MKRFFLSLSLIAASGLATIGFTSAQPDKLQSQIQQQLKADEATLQQLQQQEQADQAMLKQIQDELSQLKKRRDVPCPHWVDPDADRSVSSVEGDSKVE